MCDQNTYRLRLYFLAGELVRLHKIESESPDGTTTLSCYGPNREISWDKASMALCYYLLEFAASGVSSEGGLFEIRGDSQPEMFETLLNLLDKPKNYESLFNARLRQVFMSKNPRKSKIVHINLKLLPRASIRIYCGGRQVVEKEELNALADEIAAAFAQRPSRKHKRHLELPRVPQNSDILKAYRNYVTKKTKEIRAISIRIV